MLFLDLRRNKIQCKSRSCVGEVIWAVAREPSRTFCDGGNIQLSGPAIASGCFSGDLNVLRTCLRLGRHLNGYRDAWKERSGLGGL